MGELEAVAEGAAGGEDRVGELESADRDAEVGGHGSGRRHHTTSSKRNTGPSLQHSAAETGAEAASHRGLERRLAGDTMLAAHRRQPGEEAHRPAGVEKVVGA